MTSMWNVLRKRPERRIDGRMAAPDLDVSYSTALAQKKVRVKDISATGLYLLTDDRPQPGTGMELTLQRCRAAGDGLLDEQEHDLVARVNMRARAVRVGEDGVGVAFEQGSADAATWTNLMAVVANLTGETDRVRLFRMTKALAFVLHVSPAAEANVLQIITNKLSLERAGRAIEIALQAEEIAAAHPGVIRTDVPVELVIRILEDGSKVDEEPTRRLWSQLLAASAYEGAGDEVNQRYVILLSRIDAVQMRIFEASCKLALRVGWEDGFKFRQDLHCSAEEIKKITRIQNLMGIERDLNHLFELGLVEQTDRPILCQQIERVNLTPTLLGLKLYAHCHGQPEPPATSQGAMLQKAS